MAYADRFLPEFDQEMKTTRSLLERVPMDKASWKPHAKSRSLGEVADHLAGIARFGSLIATMSEFEGSRMPRVAPSATAEELLGRFDENVEASRRGIASMTEEDVAAIWTFTVGGHVIFALPRAGAIRALLMSHMIHHRGQLSVYLRMLDVPLPSIYGPTADT
ncbi:MAG TPA: DinB family protein [Gemmatimonadaceae bacterium]|nr:DinB family protein [Gemmatimonadaceae bacterium]